MCARVCEHVHFSQLSYVAVMCLQMCVSAYLCVCMFVSECANMHMYICMHMCDCVCMILVCLCVCVYILFVSMCICVCLSLVAVFFLQLLDHVALVDFLQALCTLDAQL